MSTNTKPDFVKLAREVNINMARSFRRAANNMDPIDRDELKAVIVAAGDAPAEIADAVVAYLSA